MHYSTKSWFICPKPVLDARARLFCFPYAGGGVPVFRGWGDGLAGVEVWVANLPGRGARFKEEPLASMPALVEALAQGLPGGDGRPFAFLGYSMGARVAFELARALRREGEALPAQLFAAASPAPQLPREQPLHTLPKAGLLAELERHNGMPQEVLAEPELLDLLLPVVRADLKVVETAVYRSEPPLACAISAFGGIDDTLVSREALAAWAEQTAGSFALSFFAGDHFFLRTAEKELLRAVAEALASAAVSGEI